MSKNRAATTFTKAGSPSRPPGATIGSSSTARRAVPAATGRWPPRRFSRASLASFWSLVRFATSREAASASSRSPAPPEQLAFDIWLGPAPQQPYHANLVHYNWHWFWDFGNGDIGNQGVHQMDIARWLIPAASSSAHGASATFPKTVMSLGGRFGYHDQGQTPNTQISVMDLRRHPAHLRGPRPEDQGFHGQRVGNIAHLEEGITIVDGRRYSIPREKPSRCRSRAW